VGEDPVEAVDEALVLDQRRTREKIEALDIIIGYMPVHPLHQREKFPERDRHLRRLEFEEEGDEHLMSRLLQHPGRDADPGRGRIPSSGRPG
jgi:hypothetical protein